MGYEVMRNPLMEEPQVLPDRPASCADDPTWQLLCTCVAASPQQRPTFSDIARAIGTIQEAAGDSGLSDWLKK